METQGMLGASLPRNEKHEKDHASCNAAVTKALLKRGRRDEKGRRTIGLDRARNGGLLRRKDAVAVQRDKGDPLAGQDGVAVAARHEQAGGRGGHLGEVARREAVEGREAAAGRDGRRRRGVACLACERACASRRDLSTMSR